MIDGTDRIPAILKPEDWDAWLATDTQSAKALLKTYDDDGVREMAPQRPSLRKSRQSKKVE
jgi:putative SOS response-associated peptidase YedK